MTACLSLTPKRGKKAALLTGSVIKGSGVSLFTASFDVHKRLRSAKEMASHRGIRFLDSLWASLNASLIAS